MSNWFTDTRNGFIAYRTTQEDIDSAYKIYNDNFKTSNKLNTKTVYNRQESRIAGILGELVFAKYVGANGRYTGKGNITYDFIVNDKKVDVKCKFRTVIPRPHFEASFFAYQGSDHFSDVDYYAFLSTMTGFEYVWFCGVISKRDWLSKGVLWKAGETDPTNGKYFDKDTWSMFYKDLGQFTSKPILHFR